MANQFDEDVRRVRRNFRIGDLLYLKDIAQLCKISRRRAQAVLRRWKEKGFALKSFGRWERIQ